jgi:hypothetical protein
MRKILSAVARRGATLLPGGAVEQNKVAKVLRMALNAANAEIGKTIDAENLPRFLERVVLSYLRAPFALADGGNQTFDDFISGVIAELDIV